MLKTLYLNLEDDVAKVVSQVSREVSVSELVLVFPKKSFLFSDSINMRLLKKQLDLLGKKVFILTMDEKGQLYAKEAGFELRHLPKQGHQAKSFSDVRRSLANKPEAVKVSFGFDPNPTPSILPPVRQSQAAPQIEKPKQHTERAPKAQVPVQKTKPKRSADLLGAKLKAVIPSITVEKKTIPDNYFMPPDSLPGVTPRRFNLPEKQKRTKSISRIILSLVVIFVVVALATVYVYAPTATVVVYGQHETVVKDLDVTIDVAVSAPDSAKLVVPAIAVNEAVESTQTFEVNGKKQLGSRAEGRVAIFNLTGSPMNLKASTTTLTVGGKNYVFKSDQSGVKPVSGPNVESGYSVGDIIASGDGEDYNLPSGTRVEIDNSAFGSQPSRLFAKTITQVVGGSARFVSVISPDDIAAAKAGLTKTITEDLNSTLAKRGGAKLVEGAYTQELIKFETDKAENSESTTFVATLKIGVKGLAFNENFLKEVVRQRILQSLSTSRNLQEPSLDSVIYKIKDFNADSGRMILSLHYESKSVPEIRSSDIAGRISGKSKDEASQVVMQNRDIEKIEISVAPAWRKALPILQSRIKVEVK